MGRHGYPNIRLVVVQERTLWQPVKFRHCLQKSPETTFTLCSGVDNGYDDRKAAFERLNDNRPATSCTNLVNFCQIISEFRLLKRAIFAAIWLQFADRSSFATLAFRNGLKYRNCDFRALISNHFCTPCGNFVTFGSVNPEFNT